MPSHRNQKSNNNTPAAEVVNQAAEEIVNGTEKIVEEVPNSTKDTIQRAAENSKRQAQAAMESAQKAAEAVSNGINGHVEDVKKKANEVYTAVQQEAQPYIEKGFQAVDNAKRSAQPYVDTAKQTAQPYVDGARTVVENSKERAQAVKNAVNQRVEDANKFDITKTTFFAASVVMLASVLAWVWSVIAAIAPLKTTVLTINDKAHATGVAGKLFEACYCATVVLERVPVVGFRMAEILRTYAEQTADETFKQIQYGQVEASKKHN